jgi:hypothetical protein
MDVIPDRSESTSGMKRSTDNLRFRWERCPRHPWLQVSVLVVGNCTPLCMDGDGTTHAVDPAELEQAA